jgi:hypothetical protein
MPSHSTSHSSIHSNSSHGHSHSHGHGIHSVPISHHGGGMTPMPVSASGARKMQTIGAIMLPIGAVLLAIGLVNFGQFMTGFFDLDLSNFGAIFAAQISAMGFIFAGAIIAFVGLFLLIIGSTRRSASAAAAKSIPSTIGSPVSTIGSPFEHELRQDQPSVTPTINSPAGQATPGATKYCPWCGAPNGKDVSLCAKCAGQL